MECRPQAVEGGSVNSRETLRTRRTEEENASRVKDVGVTGMAYPGSRATRWGDVSFGTFSHVKSDESEFRSEMWVVICSQRGASVCLEC